MFWHFIRERVVLTFLALDDPLLVDAPQKLLIF